MQRALNAFVAPKLRALGFRGTLPHFRRLDGDKADLITFQFNSSGGSFVAELAVCSQSDIASHWNSDLSLKTVTAHDMKHRRRLGSLTEGSDHWFVYGKKNYETDHQRVEPDLHYEHVASEVSQLLESQAQQWWSSRQGDQLSSGCPCPREEP